MRRTTIFLFVAVHLGVAALAIVADARAQNPPDCSACTYGVHGERAAVSA